MANFKFFSKKSKEKEETPIISEPIIDKSLSREQKQIYINKRDFFEIQKVLIDTEEIRNQIVEENFLDINYKRFLEYMKEMKRIFDEADNMRKGDLLVGDIRFDLTPEDIKLLNGEIAYTIEKIKIESETDEVLVIQATKNIELLKETENFQNREIVYKMALRNRDVLMFPDNAFKDRYINNFKVYFEKYVELAEKGYYMSNSFFMFKPLFYDLINKNFNLIYQINESGKVKLTEMGIQLYDISINVNERY